MTAPGTHIDMEALLRLRHAVVDAQRQRFQRVSALPGPIATRRRGRGSEIDDVRLWSHGDDIRHIDRNSTARTGVPHVRTFRDEREQTTLLLADFRPSMLFGTRRAFRSVVAAEILSLSGWRAVTVGGRIALLAVSGGEPILVRASTGERAMTRIIGGLQRGHAQAMTTQNTEPPLVEALNMAARALPRGGTIVLATGLDNPGTGFEDAVRRTLHRVDLRVALISDAFERTAPPGSYPFVTCTGVRGVQFVGAKMLHRAHSDGLKMLHRLGARAASFNAERPAEQQMRILERLHGGS